MKKAVLALIILSAVGGSLYAYYRYSQSAPPPILTTAPVTRGDLADTVGATGTLQAVTTVQVGTQVSGTIQELYADFNSLVRRGQVLARLEPSLFRTQIEKARANLIRAQAEVDRLKVALEDAQTKLARARELSSRQLIPQMELDNAETAVRATEAQIRSAQAQVTQAQASLNQNEVNLQHTVIAAPIDGLVISRNVDVGQTVAASMQAPTLFVLAADLMKMQVVANLDESDVGRIRPGQRVMFRVDAYPAEDFGGTVVQVRLQPIVQQNVVTYATVIDVPNPELKLKPGMTANVSIEIARRTDVVRVPNAALRLRPTNEIFAALGQAPPDSPRGGISGERLSSRPPSPVPGTAPDALGRTAGRRSAEPTEARQGPDDDGADSTVRGARGRMMQERLQALPPDQRAQMLERLRARGFDPAAGVTDTSQANSPQGRTRQGTNRPPKPAPQNSRNMQATTIDALFGPLPPTETMGRVWLYVDRQLKPVRVRLGITDGQATELLEGDLQPGTEVVTNVSTGNVPTRPPSTGGFPVFIGRDPRGGAPGGGNRGRGPGG